MAGRHDSKNRIGSNRESGGGPRPAEACENRGQRLPLAATGCHYPSPQPPQ